MRYIQAYSYLLLAICAKCVYLITLPLVKLGDFLLVCAKKLNDKRSVEVDGEETKKDAR